MNEIQETSAVLNAETDHENVLLRVEHLCQYFKMEGGELKAVDDVSFTVHKGEVFGLVGESGCGKTTTGRSIIKLYNITSGNVYFKGIRIGAGTRLYQNHIKAARKKVKDEIKAITAEMKSDPTKTEECKKKIAEAEAEFKATVAEQRKQITRAIDDQKHCDEKYAALHVQEVKDKYEPLLAAVDPADEAAKAALQKEYAEKLRLAKREKIVTQIQMIYQDPIASLDPRMTVGEIIAEGLRIKGIRDEQYIREKVYTLLETVGLVREHYNRYPHEFSGGQRQRIGIARAVIMEPEMIIADEPISALDVSIQAQVINLLNELRDKLGLTIMFIAHDLSVVKYFSDRIGVMYFGKMVELATSDELFKHPLHPYTKSLLSAIPLPDPVYEKKRQRITYNPLAEHDYRVDKPTMREVCPGHFVQCNEEEFARYKALLAAEEATN